MLGSSNTIYGGKNASVMMEYRMPTPSLRSFDILNNIRTFPLLFIVILTLRCSRHQLGQNLAMHKTTGARDYKRFVRSMREMKYKSPTIGSRRQSMRRKILVRASGEKRAMSGCSSDFSETVPVVGSSW